jgi:hypothetical protein
MDFKIWGMMIVCWNGWLKQWQKVHQEGQCEWDPCLMRAIWALNPALQWKVSTALWHVLGDAELVGWRTRMPPTLGPEESLSQYIQPFFFFLMNVLPKDGLWLWLMWYHPQGPPHCNPETLCPSGCESCWHQDEIVLVQKNWYWEIVKKNNSGLPVCVKYFTF